jgi:ATP-dependent RNA helicase RhlE
VHRIGRTGRAGQAGTAISLVAVEEQDLMQAIERLLKKPIDREVVEGFEPSFTVRAPASPDVRGDRPSSRQGRGDGARRWAADRRGAPPARRSASGGDRAGRAVLAGGPRTASPNQHAVARVMPGERLSGQRSAPGRPA